MRAFGKTLSGELNSPVPLVAWLALSVVVSIMGPFGSYGAMPLLERALFWTPVLGVLVVLGVMIRTLVTVRSGPNPGFVASLVIAGLNGLLLAPLLYGLLTLVLAGTGRLHVTGAEIAVLIVAVSLGICALRAAVEVRPAPPPAATVPQVPPRLARRLDPAISGEIWALSVRDHYVDVLTSRGATSLLMRLSDAIHEVDSQPGAQVHRSHWVAWSAVATVCREGGKIVLHLKNGQQIPVSRNHRAKVEAQFPTQFPTQVPAEFLPPPAISPEPEKGAA